MTDIVHSDDWESLMERLCLSRLSDAEWTTVVERIAVDDDARHRYVETIYLREGLPYLLANLPTVTEPMDLEERSISRTQLPALTTQALEKSSIAPIVDRPSRPKLSARWSTPTWFQAACVAYIVGAVTVWGISRWQSATRSDDDGRVPRSVTTLVVRGRESLDGVGHLGVISGFSPDAAAPGVLRSMFVGQSLRCGEVVQISTGHIRVSLNGGPEVLFTGPAEFSLMDSRSVFVRIGRLSATGAGELSIQTPLLSAKCQDAKALFEVTDSDAVSVSVDSGDVTLYSTPREGVAVAQLYELHAGEGLFAEANGDSVGIFALAASPMIGAVKTWKDVEQGYSTYEKLVLSDRPLAYWPLRHVKRNCRVLDLTQNGHDGMAIGKWTMENDNAVVVTERGAYFDGESYIEAERRPAITPRTGFTVEGWAKVAGESQPQAVFASRWVLKSETPNRQHFGYTLYAAQSNHWEFWNGSGVKGEHWQRLVSRNELERGDWTHLAATFEPTGPEADGVISGRVALYVDGQRVAEGTHRGWLTELDWPARIGAAEFVPHSLTSWLFRGFLSDIALYNYPLTEKAIQRHFQVGLAPTTAAHIESTNTPLVMNRIRFNRGNYARQ